MPAELMGLGGAMFEPANSETWRSVHGKEGAHYNVFGKGDFNGMTALRGMFPRAQANELNFCLFSTSGVHGSYTTIEECEAVVARGCKDEDGEDYEPDVTFLIVHPRIVCMRYGNCTPRTAEDFAFLKTLRASSWEAMQRIGKPDAR